MYNNFCPDGLDLEVWRTVQKLVPRYDFWFRRVIFVAIYIWFQPMSYAVFLTTLVKCLHTSLEEAEIANLFQWFDATFCIEGTFTCKQVLCNAVVNVTLRCFHRAFATGVACKQGLLTAPDTWAYTLCSTCWDQSFSEAYRDFPGRCSSNSRIMYMYRMLSRQITTGT